MRVKVCGITTVEQMQQLYQMNVDYAGIIFYPGSKRFAGESLKNCTNEIKAIDIKKIGVFVNATIAEVLEAVDAYGLNAVQLHGDEDADYCKQLMKETTVIKAIRIGADSEIEVMIAPYNDACHYFLFDTATAGFGGSGEHFNWNVLQNAMIDKPFFLSGGINARDVDKIKGLKHPFLHSIDINSRFEKAPGIKDITLINTFLYNLNN